MPRPRARCGLVLLRADGINVQPYLSQVERDTFELNLTGLDQVVFHIGVAEIPAMGCPRHARPVAIPIEQIERGWLQAQ
jgi:hypothetical protein